ncbi:MAG: phosphatase PAP2 family protein [Firmicutes bacterium]|nr:phosphatase PAP2 family protein [Bacillota bacterium]
MAEQKPAAAVYVRRIIAAAALAGFAVILICVATGHTAGFDDPVRNWFYSLRSESLTKVVIVITNLASKWVIIGLCILLLIIPRTRIPFGLPLSAGALGMILLNSLIKHLVQRPRPDVPHLAEEVGYSFPSGHSITSMFFYGLAIFLVWQNSKNRRLNIVLTVLLAIPMILIGPTRIYLGVHFPTDVLGAWCLAIAGIVLAVEILEARSRAVQARLSEPPRRS